MAFACQRNSYLKEISSKILSCVQVKNGYEVILNDTILFPEGGGQPTDHGWLGNTHVESVTRRGKDAIHLVTEKLNVGDDVVCKVDWKRRFDHMQQHSGQHLLSAIAESKYDFHTVSWDLGKSLSHIELNTPKVTSEQLEDIENACNEFIRSNTDVTVHYLTKEQSLDLPEVKSRGLPDDVVEPIRVIEIQGVERNMCCGTHVNNLSNVQVIKLLHTEPMRGGTRVFFLAGHRVFNKLSALYTVERQLTKSLSCGSDEHVSAVDKLKNNVRVFQKSLKTYLKEIAQFEAHESANKNEGFIFKHREDGDMDYIFTFMKALPESCKDRLMFICVGPVKTGGQFLIRGNENHNLEEISKRVCDIVGGKGGGKKGQYQGKASSYKNVSKVIDILKENT